MTDFATEINEAAVLRRVINPDRPTLSAAAARGILALEFPTEDKRRMKELAAKAQSNGLAKAEQREVEVFGRIDSLLAILKSKARLSLKRVARTRPTSR